MAMLEKAEAWLRGQRRKHLAKLVTYRRGNSLTVSGLFATQAETRFDADNGEILLRSRVIDWLIDRDDLPAGVVPEPGDAIEWEAPSGALIFQVCALGDEPAYRWHGRDGQTFRVHTVQVASYTPAAVITTADTGKIKADSTIRKTDVI